MKKNRILALLLAGVMTASVSAGSVFNTFADEASEQSEGALAAESESLAEEGIPEEFAGKLGEIADANGISIEELNVKINDEGYVSFLGHSYSDMQINDEDDALLSLEVISDLIGLDGISLAFYRSDVSAVSGYTYYTFYQIQETEIDGQLVPIKFSNNLIKVAVDKNGKTAAVSTFLNHGETDDISSEDILSREEVIEYAKTLVSNPDDIIEDATKLVYWDDTNTVRSVSSGKVMLAYVVYLKDNDPVAVPDTADEDNEEETKSVENYDEESENTDDIVCPEYTAIIISALKSYPDKSNKDNYNINFVTTYLCSDLGEFDNGEYTSLYFFEGKEDAGEYSYTLSMDWVKDAYEDYSGPDTMEIKVPLLYEESTGLYYLADCNRKIVMANYYECAAGGMTSDNFNTIVSKTPEDLNSWEFLYAPNPESGIEEYFFDPDYVFGVYNNMITVYDMFNTRYGFSGVDASGMPILSLVYTYDNEYPEKTADFMYNASCNGQIEDWELILTSPSLAACISPTVMGHEFTHGVNQQLTSSQYFNQPGAMMESYADIIGEELALLYSDDPVHTPWVLGGDYCPVFRNMGRPELVNNPKYIGGADYVPETVPEFDSDLDHGGVHTNSGVTNYLAYKLTHEEEVSLEEGEEILEIGNNLDMWFETLYLATFVTDFNDIAHFLTYTEKITGLSEGQQCLVNRLLKEHGLLGDCEEFQENLTEEPHADYDFTFIPETEDFFDRYEMMVINIKVEDDGNWTPMIGSMIPEDGHIVLPQSSSFNNMPYISLIDKETGVCITSHAYIVTPKSALTDNEIIFSIKEVNLTSKAQDIFVVPDGEKVTQVSKETNDMAKYLILDGEYSFTQYGKYIVFTENCESGEYNMYLITVAD